MVTFLFLIGMFVLNLTFRGTFQN